jgi:uncharacterized membrane protein
MPNSHVEKGSVLTYLWSFMFYNLGTAYICFILTHLWTKSPRDGRCQNFDSKRSAIWFTYQPTFMLFKIDELTALKYSWYKTCF